MNFEFDPSAISKLNDFRQTIGGVALSARRTVASFPCWRDCLRRHLFIRVETRSLPSGSFGIEQIGVSPHASIEPI